MNAICGIQELLAGVVIRVAEAIDIAIPELRALYVQVCHGDALNFKGV